MLEAHVAATLATVVGMFLFVNKLHVRDRISLKFCFTGFRLFLNKKVIRAFKVGWEHKQLDKIFKTYQLSIFFSANPALSWKKLFV